MQPALSLQCNSIPSIPDGRSCLSVFAICFSFVIPLLLFGTPSYPSPAVLAIGVGPTYTSWVPIYLLPISLGVYILT